MKNIMNNVWQVVLIVLAMIGYMMAKVIGEVFYSMYNVFNAFGSVCYQVRTQVCKIVEKCEKGLE